MLSLWSLKWRTIVNSFSHWVWRKLRHIIYLLFKLNNYEKE
jgi:hypothetical protein